MTLTNYFENRLIKCIFSTVQSMACTLLSPFIEYSEVCRFQDIWYNCLSEFRSMSSLRQAKDLDTIQTRELIRIFNESEVFANTWVQICVTISPIQRTITLADSTNLLVMGWGPVCVGVSGDRKKSERISFYELFKASERSGYHLDQRVDKNL